MTTDSPTPSVLAPVDVAAVLAALRDAAQCLADDARAIANSPRWRNHRETPSTRRIGELMQGFADGLQNALPAVEQMAAELAESRNLFRMQVGLAQEWRQRAEAAEADAARYRFVREAKSRGRVDMCITRCDWSAPAGAKHEILTEGEADAAIDAALQEPRP